MGIGGLGRVRLHGKNEVGAAGVLEEGMRAVADGGRVIQPFERGGFALSCPAETLLDVSCFRARHILQGLDSHRIRNFHRHHERDGGNDLRMHPYHVRAVRCGKRQREIGGDIGVFGRIQNGKYGLVRHVCSFFAMDRLWRETPTFQYLEPVSGPLTWIMLWFFELDSSDSSTAHASADLFSFVLDARIASIMARTSSAAASSGACARARTTISVEKDWPT